ncbi:hypothetical protein ILUMI_12407, partial [Ignelater luminosus]
MCKVNVQLNDLQKCRNGPLKVEEQEKLIHRRYLMKLKATNTRNILPKINVNHTEVNSKHSVGHKLPLPKQTEIVLAEHLETMAKNGFDLSKEEVLDVVKDYVKQNAFTAPFKNNRSVHD